MEIIAHRINTIEKLLQTPNEYGVEIDLRDYENELIIEHDPFKSGEKFEEYLKYYNHGTLILNIKSERIEYKVQSLLKKYNIKDYFFLDSSFPMIYSLSKIGEDNIAIRFSEFEGLDTILNMQNKIKWVWIDCFSILPIDYEIYKSLKNGNYKLCLVSPDLQGQEDKIEKYKIFLKENNIHLDAVCVKTINIDRWLV